jgi:arylsulfatase
MPEFIAPQIGKRNNTVTIEAELGEHASGVLYALGGSGGGLSCYMDDGHLYFEYNLMIVYRFLAKSQEKIAPGRHTIVVETIVKTPKPGSPADIVLRVDGKEVARTSPHMTVPALFTASESFDVGCDLGSPVARQYFDRAPFAFNGRIDQVQVKYTN